MGNTDTGVAEWLTPIADPWHEKKVAKMPTDW